MSGSNNLSKRVARAISSKLSAGGSRLRLWPIVRHVRRVAGPNVGRIRTFTTIAELSTLYGLAAEGPPGGVLMEIGSYLGASACFLGAAAMEIHGSLLCIDTWQNETMPDGSRDTWSEFQANVKNVSHVITAVRRNSLEMSAEDLPAAVWLAFIDGDHGAEAAVHDSDILAERVVEGGVLAFHDALWFPGVAKAIGKRLCSGDWKIGGLVDNLLWLRRQPRH